VTLDDLLQRDRGGFHYRRSTFQLGIYQGLPAGLPRLIGCKRPPSFQFVRYRIALSQTVTGSPCPGAPPGRSPCPPSGSPFSPTGKLYPSSRHWFVSSFETDLTGQFSCLLGPKYSGQEALLRHGLSLLRFSGPRLVTGLSRGGDDGGPSLVSGYCGSPWAADRPAYGRFRSPRMVGPGGCFGGPAARPTSNYSVSAVCLSRMIFSTALAV
jgi:hypothetical protein